MSGCGLVSALPFQIYWQTLELSLQDQKSRSWRTPVTRGGGEGGGEGGGRERGGGEREEGERERNQLLSRCTCTNSVIYFFCHFHHSTWCPANEAVVLSIT